MIQRSLILLTLCLFGLTYDIAITCGTINCPTGCNECQLIDGGPFSKNSICFDDIGGCAGQSPIKYSMGCSGDCGTDCSFTVSAKGQNANGCVNANDKIWPSFKAGLDAFYLIYIDSKNSYQWCSETCEPSSGLSTGALVGIIVGGIAVVGIATVVIVKFMKKKKAQDYQKM